MRGKRRKLGQLVERSREVERAHANKPIDRCRQANGSPPATQLRNYKEPSAAPTVEEYVETFKKSRAHRDRRTREDYASCLKTFVGAGYGHLRIDEVQSKHISEFLDSRPVGQTTKRKYFVGLRAFFYLACSKTVFGEKWLETNPVKELPTPAATTPRRVIYTLQEIGLPYGVWLLPTISARHLAPIREGIAGPADS